MPNDITDSRSSVQELVIGARRGDGQAQTELVARFQQMATGYAFAHLPDHERARDVVQEAFIDAFVRLEQLREPAAFGGWLRRIVHKHCDRVTRRSGYRAEVEGIDVRHPAVETHMPDDALDDARRRAWLKAAIEGLPEHERTVVAMHYLAGDLQAEVAAFLGLQLSAVKKRLFSARRRLTARSEIMTQANTPETITSEPLGGNIALFLAIRSGDVERARTILGGDPTLLNGEERWSDEEALGRRFYPVHELTPMLLAAGRGDLAMVDMLLELGASPEGRCGCPNGETALWAAVRNGRHDVARRLLDAGANVQATNQRGYTPLHIAAMRGESELAALLRERGADVAASAKDGRTAADCARDNGHETAALSAETVVTGIKALDLFAPIATSSIVRVHGAAETGLMVLAGELTRRIADRGGRSIWVGWEPLPWHRGELEQFVAQYGLTDVATVVAGASSSTMDDALAEASALRREHDLVALFIFQRAGHEAEVEAAYRRLVDDATVVFIIEPWREVTLGERPQPKPTGPHRARVCTDLDMAEAGLYPAVAPAATSSEHYRDRAHAELAERARACIAGGGAAAERIQAFLTQPFTVVEADTGMRGEDVALDDTLAGVQRILDGELDHLSAAALRYRGAL